MKFTDRRIQHLIALILKIVANILCYHKLYKIRPTHTAVSEKDEEALAQLSSSELASTP